MLSTNRQPQQENIKNRKPKTESNLLIKQQIDHNVQKMKLS